MWTRSVHGLRNRHQAHHLVPGPNPAARTFFDISAGGSSKLDELMKKQSINFKTLMSTVSKKQVENFENKCWQFDFALKSLDSRWSCKCINLGKHRNETTVASHDLFIAQFPTFFYFINTKYPQPPLLNT